MASNERPQNQDTYPLRRLERPEGTRQNPLTRLESSAPVGNLRAPQHGPVERHGGLNPYISSSSRPRLEVYREERPSPSRSGCSERVDVGGQSSMSSNSNENNARYHRQSYEDRMAERQYNREREGGNNNQGDQHAAFYETGHVSTQENGSLNGLGRNTYTGLTPQAGRHHYFDKGTFSFQSVVPAGEDTKATKPTWYKDIMQREDPVFHQENSYIAEDGRVTPLLVQATDLVYRGVANSTWDRTFVRNTSPLIVRLASWTIDRLIDSRGWTKRDWAWLVCQWAFSCLGLIPLLPAHFFSSSTDVKNGAKYDPFRYRDWHYCKTPRNIYESNPSLTCPLLSESRMECQRNRRQPVDDEPFEQASAQLSLDGLGDSFSPTHYRTLRPRFLCFLRDPERKELCGYDRKLVEVWMRETEAENHPDYIFVAWTKLQFTTPSDKKNLMILAEKATRDAGLSAFWCSVVCLPDQKKDELIDDVWRMSDIVRGSKKTAIVLDHQTRGEQSLKYSTTKDMLMSWGRRMWTLPEALLSPKGEKISVYVKGLSYHREIEKRSLVVQAWEDAPISRQLMDHFEGSLILTQLELMVIALQCLNNRDTNDFNIGGEMAYVLMGLLRRRPKVDITDSAFQAFARLSLANDSNMLLERLICVMPKHQHQAWHDTSDCYDAKLFDIYPTCQIAGIGNDDSVVLDGAQGASIRWDRFERVAYVNKDSMKRTISRIILQLSPVLLLTGIVLVVVGQMIPGILLLVVALAILGASPSLVRLLFTGKLWDTQALFFGFEGYMDIATIETHIFGTNMNRLTWSPYGSTLSRHEPGEHGECVGLDPTTDTETAKLVENACTADNRPNDLKVFTLVDTFTMTVVMFLAERPPVVALLCGSEGGMQRAVLCSYQSSTQTLCREAVLRMESRTAERFWLVGRLRFAFKRSMVTRRDPVRDNIADEEDNSSEIRRTVWNTMSTTLTNSLRAFGTGSGNSSV